MGDRKAIIGRAVALLAKRLHPAHMWLSDYVASTPWGYDSPNEYLNRGILVVLHNDMSPFEILDITQEIESMLGCGAPHRHADGTYCDRTIDIDIIDVDGTVVDSPRLTLPHPRASLRPFVLEPMRQLDSIYNASLR